MSTDVVHAIGSDGKLNITKASIMDAHGNATIISDGKVTETSAFSGKVQGYDIKGTHTKTSLLEGGTALSDRYDGIISGKEGHLTVDGNGKAVFAEGQSGLSMLNKHVKKNISDTQNEHKWGDLYSGGTHIDGETAYQTGLSGGQRLKDLLRNVTNPYLSKEGQQAEVMAAAGAFGKGASQFMSRSGVTADFAEGNAHLSTGLGTPGGLIFKANIGADGKVGIMTRDEKKTDLMSRQYATLINDGLKEAQNRNLNREQTIELLASKVNDYTAAHQIEVMAKSPQNFGAIAPKTIMVEAGKKFGDAITNVTGEETAQATKNAEGDLTGMPYSDGAEPKRK